jgi:hypothetical protein
VPVLIQRRSFESGLRSTPAHVRRAMLRTLTRLVSVAPPTPLADDARVTLWIPTPVTLYEHVIPNTGWSLLYDLNATEYVLIYVCESPSR